MKKKVLAYQVPEITDPLFPQYKMAAGGDVLAVAGQDCENLLRTVANMPPGCTSVTIRFLFNPKPIEGDIQSRLGIYVMARNQDEGLGDCLRLIFERGPLARFHKLQGTERFEAPWAELQAACEILRREDAVEPLHSSEFNDRIPAYYYTIDPFQAINRNDYASLDRVLAGIGEPVIIDVCVEPADVSIELSEHTRYLSRLQSINRGWDRDQEDEPGMQDYLGDDPDWRPTRRQGIKPLRYTDPLADEILRFQQRLHESLRKSHLLFHILVMAKTPAVAQLIGSVVADSAFEGGSYRLLNYSKGVRLFDEAVRSVKENHVSALPVHESLFQGKDPTLYSGLARLSHLATVDELSGVFRLPVASTSSPHCIRKNTDPPHEKDQDLIIVGYDEENPGLARGLRLSALTNHGFVSGTTGVRKTTTMLNMAVQFHQHDIPFLVIEPVKTEYRALKMLRNHPDQKARRLADEFEVYTPGNEEVSPFRYNPLDLLPGIFVDEHIGNIQACFDAAMSGPGPLQPLWGEALEQVYEDHAERKKPPIMAELVDAAEKALAEKEYSPETNSDIRAALDVRLGVLTRRSLGKVFQCRHSIPAIEHLMKVPAVIELDCLPRDQACLLSLFLLTAIREYLKTVPKAGKTPRYVIIIEEAHNIVGRTGEAQPSPDVPNPKAFAAEYVCRMLAELRALGVGIIIVDQLPSAVAPEVIKNTTTKLTFRLPDEQDREVVGASMLLSPMAMEELGRLNAGEAFFFTEGYHMPRRIKGEP